MNLNYKQQKVRISAGCMLDSFRTCEDIRSCSSFNRKDLHKKNKIVYL